VNPSLYVRWWGVASHCLYASVQTKQPYC
jgi:hypothetical protein